MIDVLKPGLMTSVQDTGRQGWRHLGVGASGAMDRVALALANLRVGNPCDAAGLEVTMGRLALGFRATADVALAGADAQATLDGEPLTVGAAVRVHAGQTLRLGVPLRGVRSYVALRGGVSVPEVLGAAATDLKGGFGGFEGRVLKQGDVLHIGPAVMARGVVRAVAPEPCAPPLPDHAGVPVFRVLPAAEWNDLDDEGRQVLLSTEWRLSAQSNRVGCRMDGPSVPMPARREMRSHGIVPGVMQLPPSGQPIVQLCDGNTSGGYPVVATVIEADLHRFAQMRPQDPLRFVMCDIAEALAQRARWSQWLHAVATCYGDAPDSDSHKDFA